MLSEFDLIRQFKKLLRTRNPHIHLGVGDDTAALTFGGKNLLFTCDSVVENVHFRLDYFSFYEVGWRLACANLSDIAAMGGKPLAAIITLGIRKGISEKNIFEAYRGITTLLSKFHCPVVGGDIVRSQQFFLDMAMLGETGRKLFTRSGARAEELVVVTGELGRSLLGFRLLSEAKKRKFSILAEKHLRPFPRLLESSFLATQVKVRAMIDISDGLSSELRHLCEQSGVGFEIEEKKLPLHPVLVKEARKLGLSPTALALSSGEEYELLFTCPPSEEKKLRTWNRRRRRTPFTIIGRTVKNPRKVILKKSRGKASIVRPTGFRHF